MAIINMLMAGMIDIRCKGVVLVPAMAIDQETSSYKCGV